jgi:dihydrodipicolinate synthase/N-acetylneuraminate lyase
MLRAQDMTGVMGMMPAFTTPDGDSLAATETVNTTELESAVDRIIRDGVDVIATMGSFGECHTLLWDEQKKLAEATIAAARKRVPVIIGCTSLNTRETLQKMKFAAAAGADGVLCGVPFYFPATVDNAVQFYLDIADAFPKLGIVIYHNPPLHHVTLPVPAFAKLVTRPNIVAMKDSHRTPLQFIQLMNIVKGKISVLCNQTQSYPYVMLGAAGCWSINAWLGPWPVLHLRDACRAGDWETAKQICLDMAAANKAPGGGEDLHWRENSAKLAMNYAGYCSPGPLRPPFRNIPPSVVEAAKQMAASWKQLCEKYPPKKAEAAA